VISLGKALSALHRKGLVHQDVRLANIVKVFDEHGQGYFMLIDFETVGEAEFLLPQGFASFRFWTPETLEGNKYTPRSDLYHMGLMLKKHMIWDLASANAKVFVQKLMKKDLDAELALNEPWLAEAS